MEIVERQGRGGQLGEVPQGRRDGSGDAVVVQLQNSQRRHVANVCRYASLQLPVAAHEHHAEAGAAADVARDDAGEHVLRQVEAPEPAEEADAGRDLAAESVVAEVERAQEGEVADGGGDGAGEPPGAEVQSYHS